MAPVVSVKDLRIRFTTPDAIVNVVNGVGFELEPGQVLGILGESGSGKSVTLRALIGLLPPRAAMSRAASASPATTSPA
jgi:peptide/nickel transport system ATP-binding protein